MSESALVRRAYAASARATSSARAIEFEVFARVTAALRREMATKSHPGLVAALADNQRLWTLLAADVADPANGLDDALRAQIFYLADFTRAFTRRILNGGTADPSILIDVNLNVMKGLKGGG